MNSKALHITSLAFMILALSAGVPSTACRNAIHKCEGFIGEMQNLACKVDTDCGVFYLCDSCHKPFVMAKPGFQTAKREGVFNLEKEIENACKSDFENRPACAPLPAEPECVNGKCVDSYKDVE